MMLKFYLLDRWLHMLDAALSRKRDVRPIAVGLLASTLASGCATLPPTAPPTPKPAPRPPTHATNPNPPADVNLSGYPLAFRQGYADGCASARKGVGQKDADRWGTDLQYRQGWTDGNAICARRR